MNYKNDRHFELIQSRNLIFHTKIGLNGLTAHLKFGDGTASGLKVMLNIVKITKQTDRG